MGTSCASPRESSSSLSKSGSPSLTSPSPASTRARLAPHRAAASPPDSDGAPAVGRVLAASTCRSPPTRQCGSAPPSTPPFA
eukprot:scaffold15427_cov90-Isochrysis_galbana.AAC.2